MNEAIKLEGYSIKLIHPNNSYVSITDENGCSKHVGVYPVVLMFKRIKELEAENETLKARVKKLIECNHRLFDKNQEYAAKIEKMADELSSIGPSDVGLMNENDRLKARVKELESEWSTEMNRKVVSNVQVGPTMDNHCLAQELKAVEKKLKAIRKGLYED